MSTIPEGWIEKPQIIVVDDNPANLRLLMDILSYEGYEVRPANSGKLALASALAAPPDLILLDVLLPDLSGYEICRELKAQPAFADIPIIFISGLDEAGEKSNAFSCGAVDFITKPFQHKEVVARVRAQLEARRLRQLLKQSQEACEAAEARIRELEAENRELKKVLDQAAVIK